MKTFLIDQSKVKDYISEKYYLDLLRSISSSIVNVEDDYRRYYILVDNNNVTCCYVLIGPENYLFYIIINQYILKGIENDILDFIEEKEIEKVKIPVLNSDIATQIIVENRGYNIEYMRESYLIYKKKVKTLSTNSDSRININKRNVLLLTNNRNGIELYNRLLDIGEKPILYSKRINREAIEEVNIDYVISYNYSYIITEDVIDTKGDKIINMHISLLPWNKGASPNFWSFIDDTPKGVTIHKIDSGLDTGEIIFQKKLEFDEQKETFKSTYELLNKEIVNLLIENWENIKQKNYQYKKNNLGGTYHSLKDFKKFTKNFPLDWNETIDSYKKSINYCEEMSPCISLMGDSQ